MRLPRSNTPRPWTGKKHRWHIGLAVCALVIVICSLVGLLVSVQSRHAKQQKTKQTETNNTAQGPAGTSNKPLQYQVVYVDKGHTPARVLVYTKETDDTRLIAVNDMVFAKYKNIGQSFLIAYFNDPKLALVYFDKVNQTNASTATKQDLQKHYIAAMTYINVPSQKVRVATLTRLVNGVKNLKSY